MTINGRAYSLYDVRDPHVGNSRDERTVLIARGSQAVVHDVMTKTSYYIAFHYGAEKVKVAFNLAEGQAHALFDEITSAIAVLRSNA